LSYVNEMPLRVRYADTDKMGWVYYGNYLTYFEAGRTEYLRDLGHTYAELEEQGVYLAVSEQVCRYWAPAMYDEMITVRTWVSRLRRTRIDFSYEVVNAAGDVLVEGRTVLGCLSGDRRPRKLPDEIREALQQQVVTDKQ